MPVLHLGHGCARPDRGSPWVFDGHWPEGEILFWQCPFCSRPIQDIPLHMLNHGFDSTISGSTVIVQWEQDTGRGH